MTFLGYTWIKFALHITSEPLLTICLQGRENVTVIRDDGVEEKYFGIKYTPDNTVMEHLEFALKYETINLSLLTQIFAKIDSLVIIDFIKAKPQGINVRKIGFLFEFLTHQTLNIDFAVGGKYVPILDESIYVTGRGVNHEKWKIRNNLLGMSNFCPVILKTLTIQSAMEFDIAKSLLNFQKTYSQSVFRRAFGYLYTKETKSSFEIEREKPSQNKMERFVTLLTKAGIENDQVFLTESTLTDKQNKIVDSRFAANGWRDFQNYIGETLPDFSQLVHYVCPPANLVKPMMEDLNACFQKSKDNHAVIVATIIAFGFVFIHPFDDGNGRLHRYLIHDILVRKKAVSSGTIIPISAQMLENIEEYDNILESYSQPLLSFIKFSLDNQGELTILNSSEVMPYFKYPNLTLQCEYLFKTLTAAITKIEFELDYLNKYDLLKNEISNHLDLPDKLLNNLIIFIHQNQGFLSKNKRKVFDKLTDSEIKMIEEMYQKTFIKVL